MPWTENSKSNPYDTELNKTTVIEKQTILLLLMSIIMSDTGRRLYT
jgi:hypothetical protein